MNENENDEKDINDFNKEDLSESYKMQLAKNKEKLEKEKQKNSKYEEEISELKKRVEKGNATQEEEKKYYSGEKMQEDAHKNMPHGITPEQLDIILKAQNSINLYDSDLKNAIEKDNEMRDLVSKNQRVFNDKEALLISSFEKSEEKIRITKELLKDPDKLEIFKIAAQLNDDGQSAFNYLNRLNDKLNKTKSPVGPSEYVESPDIHGTNDNDMYDYYEDRFGVKTNRK